MCSLEVSAVPLDNPIAGAPDLCQGGAIINFAGEGGSICIEVSTTISGLSGNTCTAPGTSLAHYQLFKNLECPQGYSPNDMGCFLSAPPESPMMCMAGAKSPNPILPATAEKYRFETDIDTGGPDPIVFSRIYRSGWRFDSLRDAGPLGKTWSHNHSAAIFAFPKASPNFVYIVAPDGFLRNFEKDAASSTWISTNSADSLVLDRDSNWIYRRSEDDAKYKFNKLGVLQSSTKINGWVTNYVYDSEGRMSSISNSFGKSIYLFYDEKNKIKEVRSSDLRVVNYAFSVEGGW